MFKFKILKKSLKSDLRIGEITTNHGKFPTPVFIPCGTKASVKAVAPEELIKIGYKIILGNTYHLYLRPGLKIFQNTLGLHQFMNWPYSILTDSGGFQVFSLAAASEKPYKNKITPGVTILKKGIKFKDHLRGDYHLFTPEKVIKIQLDLGSDILMPLDVCLPSTASKKEHQKAVDLTLNWAKRSKIALKKYLKAKTHSFKSNYKPALFGIIQGGIFPDLRKYCAQKLIELDFSGFAIGGLAVGEEKSQMLKIVKLLTQILPQDKPRYLMGVGEPNDLIKIYQFGIDMTDCVLPTRLARHGVAWYTKNWQKFSKIDFNKAKFRNDLKPIMEDCQCPACIQKFSKAYITHLIKEKEILGIRFLSLHNLSIIQNLLKKLI